MKTKVKTIKSTINRIVFLTLGSVLYTIALKEFFLPNHIIDGGITGISMMLYHALEIPLGIFILLLNLPFLIIGYKKIGKTFALSTLYSVACLSIGTAYIKLNLSITQDIFLASIFGGIALGVGVGLIIRHGGSLDGTEIVAIILDKRTGFSVGEIVMFFNLFILGVSGLVYGWEKAMYSLVAYFIAFKTIDITVEGLDSTKAIIIVSQKYEEIADELMRRLGRGVTILEGKGGYKKGTNPVIYVVLTRLEISTLKEIVNDIDENALVTIGNVELLGHKKKKKERH